MRPASARPRRASAVLGALLALAGGPAPADTADAAGTTEAAETAAAEMLPAAEQPAWNAIGRVNIGGYDSRRMCTGVLIAPDRVLTAAHCTLAAGHRPAPPGRIVFVAGWRLGEAAADAKGAALALHPGFEAGLAAGRVRVADDLAVLTLAAPIEGVAPVPVAAMPEGARPVILGYRADRPHVASRLGPCALTHRAAEVAVTACRVAQGTSGAPLLVETAAGWRTVGIVSATSAEGTLVPLPERWEAAR